MATNDGVKMSGFARVTTLSLRYRIDFSFMCSRDAYHLDPSQLNNSNPNNKQYYLPKDCWDVCHALEY